MAVPLQDFFEIAEIANFSANEQDSYQNSIKYYRDLNNVVDTSRAEGRLEGIEEGRLEGIEEGRLVQARRYAWGCGGAD